MKYKKRYVIVTFEEPINGEIENLIINTFCEMFGKISFALSGFKMLYSDKNRKLIVFRCFHNYLDEYRATIFMLHNMQKRIQAKTLFVTGTYRKAKKFVTFLN